MQAAFHWGKLNLADSRLTVTNVQVRDVDEGRAYPEPLLTLPTLTGVAAGFPDYYELFGTDGAYTGYALIVSGQWDTLLSHLRALRTVSRAVNGATGKVVHEMMTDGSVYYGNNAAAGNIAKLIGFVNSSPDSTGCAINASPCPGPSLRGTPCGRPQAGRSAR